MKPRILLVLLIAIGWFGLTSRPNCQGGNVAIRIHETTESPQAVVLSVLGKCEFSQDGTLFVPLKTGRTLKQGDVIRTGIDSRSDLFFRRIGTTVRLQAGTEVKLESMTRHLQDHLPVMRTLIEVRAGRIFTVVRTLIPGSTFEIRNKAGRSIVEGNGEGRYIITADGSHVTEVGSRIPLKVVGETGITLISPGMKYHAREGKVFPVTTPEAEEALMEFDELHSLAEQLSTPQRPPK